MDANLDVHIVVTTLFLAFDTIVMLRSREVPVYFPSGHIESEKAGRDRVS